MLNSLPVQKRGEGVGGGEGEEREWGFQLRTCAGLSNSKCLKLKYELICKKIDGWFTNMDA